MHALHLHNEFDHPVAAKQQPMHRPTIISHKMRVSLGGGIRRGVSTSRRPPIFAYNRTTLVCSMNDPCAIPTCADDTCATPYSLYLNTM